MGAFLSHTCSMTEVTEIDAHLGLTHPVAGWVE